MDFNSYELSRATISRLCPANDYCPTLEVGLSPSKKFSFIYFNDSPSKIMKRAFYFILKALFMLKIFNFFVLTFQSYRKNGSIRNVSLI